MMYKGFEITITDQMSGFGWTATPTKPEDEGADAEYPQHQGQRPYRTAADAELAAKQSVSRYIRKQQ